MVMFNPRRYNFWSIYYAVLKFYPVHIIPDERPELHASFRGTRELEDLIVDKIHKNHPDWEEFTNSINLPDEYQLFGWTLGVSPAYCSFIELSKETCGDVTRIKKIYFSVSFIAEVYTIIGEDINKVSNGNGHYWVTTNCQIVSPFGEYEELFLLLRQKIEEKFIGYRFLPYFIYTQQPNVITPTWALPRPVSIFELLFFHDFEFSKNVVGDRMFGDDQWKI